MACPFASVTMLSRRTVPHLHLITTPGTPAPVSPRLRVAVTVKTSFTSTVTMTLSRFISVEMSAKGPNLGLTLRR